VVDGFAPGGPTLLGVEMADDSAPWSARTRFGLVVAPPLAATRYSVGVSQPVLFRPDGAGTGSIDDAELLGRMLGTTALGSTTRRLGVYWEGYGFEARDTVDIELHVYREDRPGVLERIGNVLRLEGSERGGVALRWREAPGSSRAVQRADGGVAIQLRSVVLDVARLERGNYRLRVLLARPGSPVVEADRTFSIR